MKVNLSRAFAGQDAGIKEIEEGIWVVSFLNDLKRFVSCCFCGGGGGARVFIYLISLIS